MRARIPWVRISDMDILEFLDGHELEDFVAPPSVIAANMSVSESNAQQRVRILAASGLIERTDDDRGYYAITDLGRRYLADDITDEERQELEAFDPDEV